ncbi:MAG: pyrroloquinoline quinone biosynthesis protein PqqB [Acidobacteriota bacterium]
MRARILGSAAGGGFPQWNCGCANCVAVRRGDRRLRVRTQDSLAVFARDDAAVVCNASPDIAQQLAATPSLYPKKPRGTPIAAVILTNGDLDHVLGLFSLRESQPLAIYATEAVRRGLVDGNAMCATLERFAGQVAWRRLELDRDTAIADPAGQPTGIVACAFAVPGKLPVHLARTRSPSAEDNIGLSLRDARSGQHVVYAPGTAYPPPKLGDGADVLVFDGTFWSSDELIKLGLGTARAEDMAHVPVGGPEGSLRLLAAATAKKKVFTHINNSNPILPLGSHERRLVGDAGWIIAEDGMELL